METTQSANPNGNDNPRPVQPQASGGVGDIGTGKPPGNGAEPGKPKVHWPYVWGTIIGAFTLFGGLGAFYGIAHWMEDRIDKAVDRKLSDPINLRKIAAESRPILVFDGAERTVADNGAQQFVKELKITRRQKWSDAEKNLPAHVHIEFVKFMAYAPILTPISENTCRVTSERGQGLCWEFDIYWGGVLVEGLDTSKQFFRLELMP
jgi:hypothetical protein